MTNKKPVIIASILHGAYGDYYEQAVCLKAFRLRNPETRIKLFAASAHRLAEFRVLDFSWSDCFKLHTEIPNHEIDSFLQFQVKDWELHANVLSKLSPGIRRKLDLGTNLLPWRHLRTILPLSSEQQLGLSDVGRESLPRVMRDNEISPQLFQRPTIGFLWRYRSAGGAIKGGGGADPLRLAAKYSRMFRSLIQSFGCHVLVCGMKVARTEENRRRIDAKYPEFGLDLPENSCTHLRGLSWPLELEILSRCTLCVANPSGFSEALWIKRGTGVVIVDPSLHYLAKALRHRVPFFNLRRPASVLSAIWSVSDDACLATIRRHLDRLLREPDRSQEKTVENLAS